MTTSPLSTAEVELRILKIEVALNTIWNMLRNAVSREQFNRLNVIRQKEIALMETRLTQLDSDVASLRDSYNNLL
jgi:hypothetical protein